MARKDVHRPSAINPADYAYVGYTYQGSSIDAGMLYFLGDERRRIQSRMAELGARWSNHEHGGSCHVCGAYAVHLIVWHHTPSNTFIQTGQDCADKMDMGVPEAFKAVRRRVEEAGKAQAGRYKAAAQLAEHGLPEAFSYAEGWIDARLVAEVPGGAQRAATLQAQRAVEAAAALPAPAGRVELEAEVVSVREPDPTSMFPAWKMLVRSVQGGFKVWMTVPSALSGEAKALRGRRITCTVTLTPSKDDPKFAFGARPSKVELL